MHGKQTMRQHRIEQIPRPYSLERERAFHLGTFLVARRCSSVGRRGCHLDLERCVFVPWDSVIAGVHRYIPPEDVTLYPASDMESRVGFMFAQFACFLQEEDNAECGYQQKTRAHQVWECVWPFGHPLDSTFSSQRRAWSEYTRVTGYRIGQ